MNIHITCKKSKNVLNLKSYINTKTCYFCMLCVYFEEIVIELEDIESTQICYINEINRKEHIFFYIINECNIIVGVHSIRTCRTDKPLITKVRKLAFAAFSNTVLYVCRSCSFLRLCYYWFLVLL